MLGLLFKRLEGILAKEEIEFIQTIYKKTCLKLGTEPFHPNVGVAQGSTISPALFNIYLEPLLKEIHETCGIDVLDIFAYADDVLFICDTWEQLDKCVETLESWAKDNNLKINHSKSEIVMFQSRMGRPINLNRKIHKNNPLLNEYKYLGCILDRKLTLKPQMSHIRSRAESLTRKLYPVLCNASLGYRQNLWQAFILPLFEFTLPLLEYEKAETNILVINRLLRRTFRRFTFLSHNTELEDQEALMGYGLLKRSDYVRLVS